jgi:hypothetical protein
MPRGPQAAKGVEDVPADVFNGLAEHPLEQLPLADIREDVIAGTGQAGDERTDISDQSGDSAPGQARTERSVARVLAGVDLALADPPHGV